MGFAMSIAPLNVKPDYRTIAKAARKLGLVSKKYTTKKELSRGQKSYLTKLYNKQQDTLHGYLSDPDHYAVHKLSEESAAILSESEFKVLNQRVIIRKTHKKQQIRIRQHKTQVTIYSTRKKGRAGEFTKTPVFKDPLKIYKQIDDYKKQVEAFGADPEQLAASGAPYPFLRVKVNGHFSQPFDSVNELLKYLSKFNSKSIRYITLVKRTWSDETEIEDD